MSNEFADLEVPSVQAQVDPGAAKLGDLIQLNVRVSHPGALVVENPSFTKTLGTFELYASTRLAAETDPAKTVDHFQATLQNFTTGQQTIPPLEVPYRDPMGKLSSIKTPPLVVTIEEVPAGPKDKGDIRGIKGVAGPTAWSPWWWLVAVVLLFALCFLLWRKRKLARVGPPPPPPVPPDVLALEKLNVLMQSDWLSTGKIKEFYSAVSDILRGYLEGAFQTPALERTTGELMRSLQRKADISPTLQKDLRDLLDTCDLVKFAKFRPEVNEATGAHRWAVSFVEQTRPAAGEARPDGQPRKDPNDLR